jgi:imidazolonepropionase-like amidohydrolase
MVDYVGAGFTPMEALMTGTVNAATAGGIKEVGKLEPGMAADVVAMAKSPLDDIQAVMDVGFVMRGGIVYKNAGAAR